MKSLPEEDCKLLTKEEEQQLIAKWRHDREELNKRLCLHNIRMVFNCAKKYVSKTEDFDSLIQEGMRGLMTAATRFDLDRGIKFVTYATPWILKYIRATFYEKGYKVRQHSISMDTPTSASSPDGARATFANFVENFADPACHDFPSTEKQLSANETSSICHRLIEQLDTDTSLSSVDREVFKEIYCECEPPKTVAKKHSLCLADLNAIKRKVLSKFRDILERNYGC